MSLVPPHKDDEAAHKPDPGYVIGRRRGRTLQPISPDLKPPQPAALTRPQAPMPMPQEHTESNPSPAVELIRRKLDQLYTDEPGAQRIERSAMRQTPVARSKHQEFMYQLSNSGKPLAEIQTAWHNYYLGLPDHEKHQVWQEFYTTSTREKDQEEAKPKAVVVEHARPEGQATKAHQEHEKSSHRPHKTKPSKKEVRRSVADVKKQLLKKVQARNAAQLKAKHHLQSLAFGLGTGALVIVIFLFGFFNEIIITPFIQPSRHTGATPIILTTDSVATSATPEVIIPKINVQIPVDFTQTSIDEKAVDDSLDTGILHYPATAVPGQQGNGAYFGHSSNNIFNKGKYKFAFVLLHKLVPGDIFYITYNKQVYSYRVYEKRIVSPQEVSVLGNVAGKTATAALITCDPPGTSINRLVVWGEQVSPDPTGNSAAPDTTTVTGSTPTELADNGPTMWNKFTRWFSGLWGSN